MTYQPYIEMVSHISQLITVNELLILVTTSITAISFMVATFVIYEKVLVKWGHTSKDLSWFQNINKFFWNRSERRDQNPQKRPWNKVAGLTVYFETYASRTPPYGCSQNKWLFLTKFKSCSFDVWFVLMFKNMKIF